MSFVDSALLVCNIIKIGARNGDPKAEVRWVKCHEC